MGEHSSTEVVFLAILLDVLRLLRQIVGNMAGERGTVNVQPDNLTSRPSTVRRQRSIPLGVCIVRSR
jgi:hypothetical protein